MHHMSYTAILQSFGLFVIESKSTTGKDHKISLSIEFTTRKYQSADMTWHDISTEKEKLIFRELVKELLSRPLSALIS